MSYNTRRQAGQGGGKCEGSDIERKNGRTCMYRRMVWRAVIIAWCCKYCNKYG